MSFRRLALGSLTGFLSLVAFAHTLHAQEDEDGPAPVNTTASLSAGDDEDLRQRARAGESSPQDPAGHALGRYGGVVPGTVATPPAPPAPNENKPVITWPGFQMRTDGTSRVFIQSTVALAPQPSAAPGKFSVILPGAKVAAGTNRLPLETRFFNTPVTRVNIAVQREAVTVTLDLRADVAPVISSERGPNGFYFVYIDLPKGQYTKAEPTAIDAPPAPAPTPRARSQSSQALGPSSLTSSTSGKVEADSSTAKASAKVSGKAGIKLGP